MATIPETSQRAWSAGTPLRVLNLGAGVQSTALALMGVQNWHNWHCSEPLPYPAVGLIDVAIFADTQEEPDAVYRHLDWLEAQCARFFPVLRRTRGSLGDNLSRGVHATGQRFVSIPAFTAEREGDAAGLTRRQCTAEYKVEVVERCIRRDLLGLAPRQRLPKGIDVTQVYGLSHDEPGRVARLQARKAEEPFRCAFPLFEMEQTRGGCVAWLKRQNLPHTVPRSACVFCPFKRNSEWRLLRDTDPKGWGRALEIDRAIRDHDSTCTRGLDQKLYLHPSCVPLAQADLDDPETKERKRGQEMFGFVQECEGHCGL